MTEGVQDILTGQTVIGEEIQSVEDMLMSSTGLLAALGAAGLGGGASRPVAQPFKGFKETFEYAPKEEAPVQLQKTDYNQKIDRLLALGKGSNRKGMFNI